MQTFGMILLAILAFSLLIIVHEFGHFITAKRGGVQVNEFWIGMGPTLLSKEWHGTRYCLRLLPFGGACVMEGEDGESESPHSFARAKISRRALIVAAGALMNFLVGYLILYGLLMPLKALPDNAIASFQEGFAYQGEGMLMPGDQILKVNGYRVLLSKTDFNAGLARSKDGLHDIEVRRDGQKLLLEDIPLKPEFKDANGNPLYGINFQMRPANLWTRAQYAANMAVDLGRMVWDSLGMLVTGQVGINQLSGPIGVGDALVQTVKTSFSDFLMLVAFISINLGVMNLLPLPALDGGRLIFIIIEAIRRKPVPPKYEGWVHGAGLALLMLLMIYVTGNDILRLLTRG